ncbi:MAG: nucleotidyltransferase family protein [Bryobacteraceae bacterium]
MTLTEQTLLACARACVHSRQADASPDNDWAALERLASDHGVAPLVMRALPAPFASHFQDQERQRTKWGLRLTAELLRLLDLFERNAILALPFKGPVLAEALYGDLALRESCDLDLLVHPNDLASAKKVMLAAGYTTDLPADAAQQAAYLRARYELHFTTPDGVVPIEIHQAFLAPSYCLPFDYEALWQRLERQTFCGREVPALPAGDLLLMLCAHGAKHSWAELSAVCDIARLLVVAEERIYWPAVLGEARAMGAIRILLLGLSLAADLLDSPLPAEVLAQTRGDRILVSLAGQVRASLFQDSAGGNGLRFFLRTRERFRDQLRCCARLVLMPNDEDYAWLPLPEILSPLYYPLHVLRVTGKFGWVSLRSHL